MTPTWRYLRLICMGLCYACGLAWLVSLGLMSSQSTKLPDPATSHIEAWNDHGNIVYRTPLQSFLLICAWVGALGFGVTARTIEDKNWWRSIATRRGQKITLKKSKYFW